MLPVAIAAMAISGIGQGVGAYLNYRNAQKQAEATRSAGNTLGTEYDRQARIASTKRFNNTDYGSYLQNIADEGLYSKSEEQQMMGDAARTAEQYSSNARQGYMAQLAGSGLEGSVAGARGIGEIDSAKVQAMTNAQQNLQTQEKSAERQAEEAYARGATQYQEQYSQIADQYKLAALQARTASDQQALAQTAAGTQNLVSGLTSAASNIGQAAVGGFEAKAGADAMSAAKATWENSAKTWEDYQSYAMVASQYGYQLPKEN